MTKEKIYNGYCPFCGEFITTNLEKNAVVVKHKKYITVYHKKCYEFNTGLILDDNGNVKGVF